MFWIGTSTSVVDVVVNREVDSSLDQLMDERTMQIRMAELEDKLRLQREVEELMRPAMKDYIERTIRSKPRCAYTEDDGSNHIDYNLY